MSLVETSWLEENINKVKIIDCSWHMPQTKRNGFDEYEKEHITNAIFFDLDKNSKIDTDLPHMLTDVKSWEKILNGMGIKNDDEVVVYDNSGDLEDLVAASTYSGIEFTEVYRTITFKRGATAVANESGFKAFEFALNQNYPNPFNPSTAISFTIPTASKVSLSVYNVLGQRVATLVNRDLSAGAHAFTFDASALSSGMYFYTIATQDRQVTKRMQVK